MNLIKYSLDIDYGKKVLKYLSQVVVRGSDDFPEQSNSEMRKSSNPKKKRVLPKLIPLEPIILVSDPRVSLRNSIIRQVCS